jgi:hypothetical protein
MKKTFALLIVVAIVASFLAGCKPQPDPEANSSTPMKATPKDKKLSGTYNQTE